MSLNWNFKDKVGEMTYTMAIDRDGNRKEFTASLYEGNAFLIFLCEWEEDGKEYYSLHSFWADEEHMKRMLGLKPKEGYGTNEYNGGLGDVRASKFRFNKAKCRHLNKIIPALIKAFDAIDIEIYNEQ